MCAQSYPAYPIKVVIPWPPGQATDVVARTVAEKLGTALGRPLVADNRAGAGGTIGTEVASKASPDGYTILVVFAVAIIWPEIRRIGALRDARADESLL